MERVKSFPSNLKGHSWRFSVATIGKEKSIVIKTFWEADKQKE